MTAAVQPRERVIEARGLRFHYVEWGREGAPALVLLHGLSAMCRIWDPLAGAVQRRWHLYAPDQRGHGDSSWPAGPEYATDDYVADLEALVKAWGLERFGLVGLSMGGMNAMAYAARHPDRVTHLVVVDIRPAIDRDRRPSAAVDRHIAEHGHPVFADVEAAFKLRKASHPYTADDQVRHHVEHLLKQLPDGRWTYKHDPRVSDSWSPSDLWAELPKIAAPTVIVRGGRSQVLSERAAARMRDAFPNAELVTVEEAGHTVPEDRPQEFIDVVEGFLRRYPPS